MSHTIASGSLRNGNISELSFSKDYICHALKDTVNYIIESWDDASAQTLLDELSEKRNDAQEQSRPQEYESRGQIVHGDGSQLVLSPRGLRDIAVSMQLLHDAHVERAVEVAVDLARPRPVQR